MSFRNKMSRDCTFVSMKVLFHSVSDLCPKLFPFRALSFVFLYITAATAATFAQQVVLNTRGERIVVFPDGSWRYFEEADSTILDKQLLRKDVIVPDDGNIPVNERSARHPSTDHDVAELAVRFSRLASADAGSARQALRRAVDHKFDVEARLNQARDNRRLIEPDILDSLEEAHDNATEEVKSARRHYKWTVKMAHGAQKALSQPIARKSKSLQKLVVARNMYYGRNPHLQSYDLAATRAPSPSVPASPQTPTRTPAEREVAPPVKSPATKSTKEDKIKEPKVRALREKPMPAEEIRPVYRRAPAPCQLVDRPVQGASEFAKSIRPQLFFRHTDEELRTYFRDQELMTCYASLTTIENNTYLQLEFQIASPNARRNFGILESGSLMRLRMINGTSVDMYNTRTDLGRVDPYSGNTIFTGTYQIDKDAERTLSRTELDKIRVIWSVGYEDYDIVDLDFLINQFACLRGA